MKLTLKMSWSWMSRRSVDCEEEDEALMDSVFLWNGLWHTTRNLFSNLRWTFLGFTKTPIYIQLCLLRQMLIYIYTALFTKTNAHIPLYCSVHKKQMPIYPYTVTFTKTYDYIPIYCYVHKEKWLNTYILLHSQRQMLLYLFTAPFFECLSPAGAISWSQRVRLGWWSHLLIIPVHRLLCNRKSSLYKFISARLRDKCLQD